MKKMRKGKKILLISLIALVVVIVAIFVIKFISDKTPETPDIPEQQPVILLPETTYSDMQVKNIHMEYLKDNNQTMITMDVLNSTDKVVEEDHFDAILIGPDEKALAQLQTYIPTLQIGEQCSISVVYGGDLTATKQIKLMDK